MLLDQNRLAELPAQSQDTKQGIPQVSFWVFFFSISGDLKLKPDSCKKGNKSGEYSSHLLSYIRAGHILRESCNDLGLLALTQFIVMFPKATFTRHK